MNNIHEMNIKILFTEWMFKNYGLERVHLIVNEFAANNSSVRADLMAIVGDDIVAIEIKSENDKLSRLEKQVSHLKLLYNRVEIVAAEKHTDRSIELCKKEGVGLHIIKDSQIKTLLRGRSRRIDTHALNYTLFPQKIRKLTEFHPTELYYKSFLMRKYEAARHELDILRADSSAISGSFIRRLNPNFVRSKQRDIKRKNYIEDLIKSIEKLQSTQSSSSSSAEISSP